MVSGPGAIVTGTSALRRSAAAWRPRRPFGPSVATTPGSSEPPGNVAGAALIGHTHATPRRCSSGVAPDRAGIHGDEVGGELRQGLPGVVPQLDRERVDALAADAETIGGPRPRRGLETQGEGAQPGAVGDERVEWRLHLVEHRTEAATGDGTVEGSSRT